MRRFSMLAILVVALATLACDDAQSPMAPTPPPPPPPPGGGGSSLKVVSLAIGGPDSVPPGGSVQLSVTARLSDGSSRDVTGDVEWGSHGDKLSVSSTGLVTAGLERGEGQVTAKYTRLPSVNPGVPWASRTQFVLPPGTYRLYGSIKDAGVYLNGVRVEIVAGSASGMSVTANGFFYFYGVEGDTEIRLSKDGYQTQQRRFTVAGHHTEDITLELARPRLEVAGTYTLTVTAAAECRADLPADVRQRSYRANIAQDGPRFTITLETGKFFSQPHTGVSNRFFGAVEVERASLIAYGYYDDFGMGISPPSVFEELTAPTHFTFYGMALITPTPNGFVGTLEGGLAVVRVLSVYDYQLDAFCQSTSHEFLLEKTRF